MNPTCDTCPHWNQKTDNRGYCLNAKVIEAVGITVRSCPESLENVDEMHKFRQEVAESCEVYFMKDFCCIHHPDFTSPRKSPVPKSSRD